jgi:ribosomal protein S4
MYAHKAFILLEMQLNATLVRTKLVPYLFLVRDLCFYRLVQINTTVVNNPYQVVSLYDSVSIPVYLHNYMYYRQYRLQYYPQNIGAFFKQY